MKKSIQFMTASALCLFTISARALTLISDYDDTIKISQVRSKAWSYYNAVLGNQVFSGMPQLLQGFKAEDASIVIASGSPKLVAFNVKAVIKKQNIPADTVALLGKPEAKGKYLEGLLNTLQDDVVLMGDDQELDPSFYQALQRAHPQKIKAIYIHQVNNRVLPAGQIGFYTAYEVALEEVKAGRMPLAAAQRVKNKIMQDLSVAQKDPYLGERISRAIIPLWHKCGGKDFLNRSREVSQSLGLDDAAYFDQVNQIIEKNCQD